MDRTTKERVEPATTGQGFGAAAVPRRPRATLADRQQRLVRETLESHGWVEGDFWGFSPDGDVFIYCQELADFFAERVRGVPQGPGAATTGG